MVILCVCVGIGHVAAGLHRRQGEVRQVPAPLGRQVRVSTGHCPADPEAAYKNKILL